MELQTKAKIMFERRTIDGWKQRENVVFFFLFVFLPFISFEVGFGLSELISEKLNKDKYLLKTPNNDMNTLRQESEISSFLCCFGIEKCSASLTHINNFARLNNKNSVIAASHSIAEPVTVFFLFLSSKFLSEFCVDSTPELCWLCI